YAAVVSGSPSQLAAVREGRAGVQDEGSQLVALALSRAESPAGPWLDLCAGPGGKAALLTGLAAGQGERLVAAERQPHRARLVAQALRGYAGRRGPDRLDQSPLVVAADGTCPAWHPGSFARVLADVPCTGTGALRRRPDARWRHQESDLAELVPLQERLLHSALDAVVPGGVVAYVTCSPHPAETEQVVRAVHDQRDDVSVLDAWSYLSEVDDIARGPFIQLWPHRHSTDAMFCALLRRRDRA
ncbi:MAG: RsmB/NOP family class I SAM-dependent RNA methyltransferase, partial [Actinomycetia bacterium]|nr:RsmB/NOP family class I SAM-dependent RNA methyltransferase [Actinomycetes bacterium]